MYISVYFSTNFDKFYPNTRSHIAEEGTFILTVIRDIVLKMVYREVENMRRYQFIYFAFYFRIVEFSRERRSLGSEPVSFNEAFMSLLHSSVYKLQLEASFR